MKVRKDREASKRRSIAIKQNIKTLFDKFNSIRIQDGHEPIEIPVDKEFTFNNNGTQVKMKADSILPTQELFSLAQELVRPDDEPFKARDVYFFDNSFHPGSREVGYDILDQEGEAAVVATGLEFANIPRADITINRNLNRPVKIAVACKYLRDDILQFDLRNSRGFGPAVALVAEKLETARKIVRRKEDKVVWLGEPGPGSTKIMAGVLDFFKNTDTEADRGFGLFETVAAGVGGVPWADKTPDEIVTDIRRGRQYLKGFSNSYDPNTLVLTPDRAENLFMTRVGTSSDRTIAEFIIQAFKQDGTDLKIVTTNAVLNTNTAIGVEIFLLLDSRPTNFSVAMLQDITLLPPKEDAQGNVLQIVELRLGGFQAKHGDAAYQGRGI